MRVDKVRVYDLEESVQASKYPMAIDTNVGTGDITKMTLALANSKKGSGHDQFQTGIRVAFDLTCTNKMWVELERYRFVEFVSSQSTMHRITKFDLKQQCNEYVWDSTIYKLNHKIDIYNGMNNKTSPEAKELYLEILYNIPSGFELTARLTTNYRALKTVYTQRKNHRLPEWREFCKWILTLPHSELIVGKEVDLD